MAVLVVSLHSGALSDVTWFGASILNQGIARLAVPFFFLLTGFFMGPTLDTGFGKWALRIVGLYVAWSLICAPVWLAAGFSDIGLIKNIVVGYYHLWYLTALLVGGCLLVLLKSARSATLVALATGLYFIAAATELYIRTEGPYFDLPEYLAVLPYRNGVFFGFPFMAIGLVIARHKSRLGAMSPVEVSVLVGVAFIAHLVEVLTYFTLFDMQGPYNCLFGLLVATPALLLLLMRLTDNRIGPGLGRAATGIYFVHIPVLVTLNMFWPQGSPTTSFLITLLLSLAAVPALGAANRRVPLL